MFYLVILPEPEELTNLTELAYILRRDLAREVACVNPAEWEFTFDSLFKPGIYENLGTMYGPGRKIGTRVGFSLPELDRYFSIFMDSWSSYEAEMFLLERLNEIGPRLE